MSYLSIAWCTAQSDEPLPFLTGTFKTRLCEDDSHLGNQRHDLSNLKLLADQNLMGRGRTESFGKQKRSDGLLVQ